MNWFGSGFIQIITYANADNAALDTDALLTEDNLNILTESSQKLLVES